MMDMSACDNPTLKQHNFLQVAGSKGRILRVTSWTLSFGLLVPTVSMSLERVIRKILTRHQSLCTVPAAPKQFKYLCIDQH